MEGEKEPIMQYSPSDQILIERAQKGDRAAFDELYQRYKRPILNYTYRFVGDLSHAEELTQETFIRVYINLARFEPETKFSSWVYTIAGNLCKNLLRDKKYRGEISIHKDVSKGEGTVTLLDLIADEEKTPDKEAIKKEKRRLIQKAINQLKPDHKQVIILCDIQGLSYEKAAEIMKCKVATVGTRLSRAREKLANILGFMKGKKR